MELYNNTRHRHGRYLRLINNFHDSMLDVDAACYERHMAILADPPRGVVPLETRRYAARLKARLCGFSDCLCSGPSGERD